jgi:hypothetical protein
MGEITYQGEPPFHLAMTQPATVRGGYGTVEMTVFASVQGRGPADVPVRLVFPIAEALQLRTDLDQAIREAQKRKR